MELRSSAVQWFEGFIQVQLQFQSCADCRSGAREFRVRVKFPEPLAALSIARRTRMWLPAVVPSFRFSTLCTSRTLCPCLSTFSKLLLFRHMTANSQSTVDSKQLTCKRCKSGFHPLTAGGCAADAPGTTYDCKTTYSS